MSTDLTKQTIGTAICSRGKTPVKMLVAPDGSATVRLGKSLEDVATGAMRATGPRAVDFAINKGVITDEDIRETLQVVRSGGRVILRGETFDCVDVRVRSL